MKINNKAFTLVELLVVVLIIGILAAIAVPQYQKAVLKADLHKGIPLVESIYQAQQSYYLTHGDFANDIDKLDLTVPKDESCRKTQNSSTSVYYCSFGTIGMYNSSANVQFIIKAKGKNQIAYLHYLKDLNSGNLERKAGDVFCFANTSNQTAKDICLSMGGVLGNSDSSWTRYKIRSN